MTVARSSDRVGRSEVALSRICLGTMRLEKAGGATAASDLLRHAQDIGIASVHCSSEYPSFPLFREAWERVPRAARASATVVAKVAAPHFGEDRFSAAAFREKIDFYLRELSLDRLDVVQWLLRFDLQQEDARLRIFAEAHHEIALAVEDLKRAGKIGSLVGFPYTVGMGGALLQADFCDGLALYVNPLEREMDTLINAAGSADKSVLAIRPFAAGRLFAETQLRAEDALAHVFAFQPVVTAIVSASSARHLDQLRPHLSLAAA